MQKEYTEKELLRLIKFVPIMMIALFSIIITYIIINNSINKHDISIESLTYNLKKEKKELIKNETKKIIRQVNYAKDLAEENLKDILKKRVNNAYNIIQNVYNQNKTKNKKEIIKIIKNAIRPIRYDNNRGYFFIYNMQGVNILLPPAPKFEGKNMIELQDKKGFFMIKESINIAREYKEGFIQWYWYKPNDNNKTYKKLGYIKYIESLDLFIGIGEYFNDFENELKNKLINEININKYNNGENYFFIENYNGKFLNNAQDEIDNKNYRSEIGKLTYTNHFIEYKTTNNGIKLSYIDYVDGWDWYIGTGVYLSKIDEVIRKNTKEFDLILRETVFTIIALSLSLTFILILLLWKFSNSIEIKFFKYKELLTEQNNNNKAKDKLIYEQSKMASMGEMIENISHQWRQPLSVILTSSSSIQLKLLMNDYDTKSIDKSCKIINENTMYLSKTIDDFSNYLSGEREKNNFYLKKTFETITNLIESSLSINSINLIIDVDDDIKIYGYENELLQCLMNICNNAKDALIEKNIENKIIKIDAYIKDEKLIITITDNACGIPNDIISKIFEPYFTTKHKSVGTGIGLHMTYDLIVNGMNGSINVNNITYNYLNTSYTGAMFRITLPIK